MKKEGKGRKDKIVDQEETFSGLESGNDEFGFEYDFFIRESGKGTKKELTRHQPDKPKKRGETKDQSKEFFLPDFFIHED